MSTASGRECRGLSGVLVGFLPFLFRRSFLLETSTHFSSLLEAFRWSYLLHLLYHQTSHQVLEGIEVADLHVIPQRPELLLRFLNAISDIAVHILPPEEAVCLLQGRLHLL